MTRGRNDRTYDRKYVVFFLLFSYLFLLPTVDLQGPSMPSEDKEKILSRT